MTLVADSSRVMQAVERLLDWVPRAWRQSRTGGAIQDAWEEFAALEVWQRVRLVGSVLLITVVTVGVISLLFPSPTNRAAAGVWFFMLLAAIGLVVASRQIAHAWLDRAASTVRSE